MFFELLQKLSYFYCPWVHVASSSPPGRALGESRHAHVVATSRLNRETPNGGAHTDTVLRVAVQLLSLSTLNASSCYKFVLDTFIILLLNADTIL